MDIRKWLDETVPPEHPAGLQALPTADSPIRLNYPEKVPKAKHLPKRSRADSSLLEPSPPRRTTTKRRRKLSTECGTQEGAPSDDPGGVLSEPSRCSRSSGRYARRPRRKTRPDRYEPSSKAADGRAKHVHRNRKDESKQTRCKSKHKKGDNVGGSIGHDFHAKNVSGDRLTLKPREQSGIFNKGRTSMAVKGRGLPDLVFSEMKFLQKHDEPTNLPQRPEATKKKRKKDHVRSKEGEISAYFTNVRPALAEKDQNLPDHQRRRGKDPSSVSVHRELEQRLMDDTVVSTVEAADKASYLGFGSRGPRHESTSYVTWSESIRAHSTTPARPLNRSSTHGRQEKPAREQNCSEALHDDSRPNSSLRRAPRTESHVGGSRLADRFQASSINLSRRPVSRSQSFPERTLSPRRVHGINRVTKLPATDYSGSPLSMPPSLPTHVEPSNARPRHLHSSKEDKSGLTSLPSNNRNTTHQSRHTGSDHNDTSVMAPSMSSNLDKTIQECNNVFFGRHRPAPTYNTDAARYDASHSARRTERHGDIDVGSTAQQPPRVRFAATEVRRPTLASFAGPGLYEQQGQHEQYPQSHFDARRTELLHFGAEEYLSDDDNMAEEEQDLEGIVDETGLYRHEADGGVYHGDDGYVEESRVEHVASGDSVVAAGFWRPNRLY
ncbi:hypothetical protein NX059_003941 [Plenodomus lindquistii]|nr:hypothetical protein NX059_003941 [Plenodomus lindquistii]